MVFLGIIVSIVMFSIIVIIHEYGHYKTARIFKIHVEEFGLGIPPRAKKLWVNKTWTLFSLNWIPLGGFVKIAGENEIADSSTAHIWENFYEKNIFQKSAVLLAGVVMNFLLAAIIFSVLFFIWVKPVWINTFIETSLPSKLIPTLEQSLEYWIIIQEPWVLLFPLENSIAQNSGIQKWDILREVDAHNVENIELLQELISQSAENQLHFKIIRNSQEITISITPDNEWKIGSYLAPNYLAQEDFLYKYWIGESIKYGFLEMYYQSRLTLSGLWFLVKNIIQPEKPEDREQALDQVAGPIGIVSIITGALSGGISLLFILWAIISVNLWVFNLLPIPALDGGRLVLLWIRSGIEYLFWKSDKTRKLENIIHISFFLLLIALSILISYNDISKLF